MYVRIKRREKKGEIDKEKERLAKEWKKLKSDIEKKK